MFAAARPIYRVDEIRRIEAAFSKTEPPLMERAGESCRRACHKLIGKDRQAILVVCGPATMAATHWCSPACCARPDAPPLRGPRR